MLTGETIKKTIQIPFYQCISGEEILDLTVSYRTYGGAISENAVLVCHALTGNSEVSGPEGWWAKLIASGKCIDTDRFPVIAFDIPGNGVENLPIDPKALKLKDIARIIIKALKQLNISKLYAGIGGSLGGGLIWELAVEMPELFEYIFPIGTHYESSDWLVGSNFVQEKILETSSESVQVARMLAMLLYRSSEDFDTKFNRSFHESGVKNVQSYLSYQGEKLNKRFSKESYLAMNHLLSEIDVSFGYENLSEALGRIQSKIRMIGIDSDVLFPTHFNKKALELLKELEKDVKYLELNSLHGHDAFLIEFEQLENLITSYFNPS